MNDFQAVADRVEIEAPRGEYTDAAMMRDPARLGMIELDGDTTTAFFHDQGVLQVVLTT
ncbi:hypothetical protein WEI85_38795 [Actinomycetes bacterium KLBMP 9797]